MCLIGNLCVSVKNMLGCLAVMCKKISSSNITEKTLTLGGERGGGWQSLRILHIIGLRW